jgi:hypothetical protein
MVKGVNTALIPGKRYEGSLTVFWHKYLSVRAFLITAIHEEGFDI